MKNLFVITLTITFLSLSNFSFAQYGPDIGYEKGDVEVSIGLGLMNTFIDKNTEAPIPPLSLNIGYRLTKTISVGTYMGYSKTVYVAPPSGISDDPAIPELTNNHFQIGLRGQAHFTQDRLDFYGGAMIGYNFSINSFENLPEDDRLENIKAEEFSDAVIFSGHVGAKYLLTQHLGIFGEVGYGVSIFNIGITTRF